MPGLIVCATQRSGSTLLCELLKATGVAGIPNEYFQLFKDTGLPDQPRQYLAGLRDRFPCPILHIDTGHNVAEVLEFRDRRVAELGEQLIVASVARPSPGARLRCGCV